jgi:glycosyltransferase involved in cell wall biosynthesis
VLLQHHSGSQQRDKPVILVVGHCGIPTGFSRVLRQIILTLSAADFSVHHLAINLSQGEPFPDWPCPVLHNHDPQDIHSPAVLLHVLDLLRPDVVLILDEPWACARFMPAFALHPQVRAVLYLAIHGRESLSPPIVADLAAAHHLVAFTPRARDLLHQALQPLAAGLRISVVPHGVDTQAFCPLLKTPDGLPSHARISHARQQLFPHSPELNNAFIVLNANRNQPFKGIDRCLEGFARFAQGKPTNVRLYLHMGSRLALRNEVPFVDQLGIRDRILPRHLPTVHPSADDAWLNLLYNACDVGINTSQREGWGLVSFEHAATGAAQIVPNHSSTAELWPGSALLLDTEVPDAPPCPIFGGDNVQVGAISEALETVYTNAPLRETMSTAAYRFATAELFQWSRIGHMWSNLLRTLLAG